MNILRASHDMHTDDPHTVCYRGRRHIRQLCRFIKDGSQGSKPRTRHRTHDLRVEGSRHVFRALSLPNTGQTISMDKAPNFSLVHGVRKPVEMGGSATPSPSIQTEPERVSTAPTASSTFSRTLNWAKSGTTEETFPEPRSSRRRRRHTTEYKDNVSDTVESHRIVIAIDYGTTFTGAYLSWEPSNIDLLMTLI